MLNRSALASLLLAAVSAIAAKPESVAADVFGLDKVWHVHLDIPAKDYETMQPVIAMRGRGGLAPQPPAAENRPANADVHRGSGFGNEYPIVHGRVIIDGETHANAGLRYKGNASYMASARSLKRSIKVELDHFDANAAKFHGLRKLNLNSGVMDPTKGREAFAFAAFRAAGVPAPRTAFAEVTLTVPGKYDREYLGLFTFVEQVDRRFLKDRFPLTQPSPPGGEGRVRGGKGLLMKPEGMREVNYLGDQWDRYKGPYRPRHEPSKKEARRVIEFARLVHRASDEEFKKQIGSY